jgi:hypothetical protein
VVHAVSSTHRSPADNDDELSIGAWFERAGRFAGPVIASCITLDEAAARLAATITGTSDLRRLRRATWDAETLLGTEALIAQLLSATVEHALADERSAEPGHHVRTRVGVSRSVDE